MIGQYHFSRFVKFWGLNFSEFVNSLKISASLQIRWSFQRVYKSAEYSSSFTNSRIWRIRCNIYTPWRTPGKPLSLQYKNWNYTFNITSSIAKKIYYILNMVARKATKILLYHNVILGAKKVRMEVLRNISRPAGPTT